MAKIIFFKKEFKSIFDFLVFLFVLALFGYSLYKILAYFGLLTKFF